MPWRLLQTGRQNRTLKCIDLHGLGERMFNVLPGLKDMVTQTFAGFRANGIRFLFRYLKALWKKVYR
jgi:hypothetical protein